MSAATRWSAASVAIGAVVVAGAVVVVLPQHALSVARVLIATVAIVALSAAGIKIFDSVDPAQPGPTGPRSPFVSAAAHRRFDRDQPTSLSRVRGEIGSGVVRADLAPLSSLSAQRLATVVATALEREGLDLADPSHAAAVRARLSPQALAAVTADRSMRGAAGRSPHPGRSASADEIAATIHAVLDELDRPQSSPGAP